MSSELIEQRRASIKRHLFLLCPNNSGSTYLSRALATSQSVWSLEREGQHTLGFAGPHTGASPWPLIWAAEEKSLTHFRNSRDYDWERTKKAWYFHATAARDDAPVFHTKSPPFLLIADQLAANFENPSFLFMVRNPYAALEGILRRRKPVDDGDLQLNMPRIAARHLITCFKYQRDNIARYADDSFAFSYEALCSDPAEIARGISELAPELNDLHLSQRLAVKGTYDETLRNMNDDQIARLTDAQIAMANEVFRPNAELLSHFDYSLIRT
ncbi:sulfotransferase [Pontixanthobacter sp. CEM42]|uniref:sulfotransferase n=1 Tax=Pontixanthobacter sp. CEM42 TaxID=2792077 RepID=UPI001ADEC5F3|nr:sulfotransferase [Pontixanthobacter sp. CEM42]